MRGAIDQYEIIAGERRWRAAQRAGLHDVPVVLLEVSDREALELAIIENVQRADLNALEEANGYQALVDEFKYSQDDIAKIVGKSRSHVTNTLRLLKLPDGVQAYIRDGKLSAGHARALLGQPDPEAIAQAIVAQGLNVRQVEAIAQERAAKAGKVAKTRQRGEKDADTLALEKRLSDALGLVVTIAHRGEGGELKIRYKTLEQLDEVIRRIERDLSLIRGAPRCARSCVRARCAIVSARSDVTPRIERGLGQHRHRLGEPLGGPAAAAPSRSAACGGNESAAARRSITAEADGAALDLEAQRMQPLDLAQRRADDRDRRGAGDQRLGEFLLDVGELAGEGRVDQRVERERGGIRHDRHDVVDLDRAPGRAHRAQLAQLGARGAAVAAEQRNERGARVRRDRQAGGAHLLVDQPAEVARRRRRSRGSRPRSWRARRRCAARRRASGRRPRSPRGNRAAAPRARASTAGTMLRLPARTRIARRPPNSGMVGRLVDQARRIGGERIAVEAHQRERIGRIVDRGAHDRVDALADQAGIGAEHQHDGARRIGTCDEGFDVRGLERDHEAAQVPATKNDARRVRMFSAITLAARSSASSRARTRAKRCCWPG